MAVALPPAGVGIGFLSSMMSAERATWRASGATDGKQRKGAMRQIPPDTLLLPRLTRL